MLRSRSGATSARFSGLPQSHLFSCRLSPHFLLFFLSVRPSCWILIREVSYAVYHNLYWLLRTWSLLAYDPHNQWSWCTVRIPILRCTYFHVDISDLLISVFRNEASSYTSEDSINLLKMSIHSAHTSRSYSKSFSKEIQTYGLHEQNPWYWQHKY